MQDIKQLREDIKRNYGSLNHQVCSRALTIDDMLEDIIPKVEQLISLAVEQEKERVLAMVLKEIEETKRLAIPETASQSACLECGFRNDKVDMCQCNFNQALDTLKKKLQAKE